jgi:hypothetical protein
MNLWSRVRHKGKRTGEMDQKTGGGSGSNYAPIDRRTSRLQTPATSHDDFDSRAPRSWKATEEAARPEKESPPRPANPADYINYGPFFLVIVAAASGREKRITQNVIRINLWIKPLLSPRRGKRALPGLLAATGFDQ